MLRQAKVDGVLIGETLMCSFNSSGFCSSMIADAAVRQQPNRWLSDYAGFLSAQSRRQVLVTGITNRAQLPLFERMM